MLWEKIGKKITGYSGKSKKKKKKSARKMNTEGMNKFKKAKKKNLKEMSIFEKCLTTISDS